MSINRQNILIIYRWLIVVDFYVILKHKEKKGCFKKNHKIYTKYVIDK